MKILENQIYKNFIIEKWLIFIAVLVNFTGLLSPIWGVDANLYASISKTMVIENNYVELFSKGKDWLDKPHFPFWVVAIFFKLFGFKAWAYKLPAILFVLAGAYYTFLLAKILYNKQVAYWATIILLTAQHIVVSNNDVRAEPYLLGLIIASVYHFYLSYAKNNYTHLVLACFFTACAIMTKGVFAIIPIAGAITGELLIKKQWKTIFNWRWILAFVLIAIFILPEIYCLYTQFDTHPEKIIFNRQNISGIKFFFWDSQFGRFFNTGPIKGSGEITFFLHTILWAFLPWSILWYLALYNYFKKYWHNLQQTEWISLSASLLMLLIFSVSKFQLPHYINILFPFFAITTAQYLYCISQKKAIKSLQNLQYIVISLMILVISALHYFFKPQDFFSVFIALECMLFVVLILILKQKLYSIKKMIITCVLVSFMVNIYLNLSFYPSLVKYESGTEIAFFINRNFAKNGFVYTSLNNNSDALMFSLDKNLKLINLEKSNLNFKKPSLFVGSASDIDNLKSKNLKISEIKAFPNFHITILNAGFINNITRKNSLELKHLVWVY